MSRFGGEIPQRWDRDRFERFGARGPPGRSYEEDYQFEERDRPGRRDVQVIDRIDERGPRGDFRERDRYVEHDRFEPPPAVGRPRRRTDRELFGDVDPRELAGMAVTPYRGNNVSRDDEEFDRRAPPPRPGLLRRQSSLDTFDRRAPARYEREDYRVPAYTPVPLPIRRRDDRYEDRDPYRAPEDYREVEITRERSVHRRRGDDDARSEAPSERSEARTAKSRKSRAKTVTTAKSVTTRQTSPSSASSESFEEIEKAESIRESIAETARRVKKGKTRMPKRLVRCEAIQDLGYPYEEEEDFYVLRIALEKEQIDEVIKISEHYKENGTKHVYRFEEKIEQSAPPALPPPPIGEHEEVIRTEWVNPPTIIMGGGRSVRAPSPSSKSTTTRRTSPARTHRTRASRSRAPSSPGTIFEERRTVIEEDRGMPPAPFYPVAPSRSHYGGGEEFYEERKTVFEESHGPPPPPPGAPSMPSGALVIREHTRDYRNDRDIQSEIRQLEAERRALRLEREAEEKRDMALRVRQQKTEEDFQLVEYRERRPERDVLLIEEREREKSPARNVVRVEKDRKGRLALVRSAH
ncbi:hypothetical protein LTR62_004806 [Meristemomyces frigidus]|uniref:DUF8035 domain-containing protein n=1 Tax=Meristemomyces frigidus TaxID=1508187 RepID=A0AAN7YFU2_9PEZI|nr:hypothetical protein LTR62_004806 [Meristemomyces frigidus]